VQQECQWAFTLYREEPNRIILPVIVSAIESKDLNKAMLFLSNFVRVEAPGLKPLPLPAMIERTLWLLGLTPRGTEPVIIAPQPREGLEDLLTQGRACLAKEDFARALPFFERAAQLAPGNATIWMNLGFTYRELKQWVYSLALYERAAALDSKRANALTGKGLALLGLKQYGEALEAFELGTKRQRGEYSYAWNGKGLALRGLGRNEQALKAFDEAIKRRSTNPYFWGNKAAVLRALGRTAEAEAAVRRAHELGG
jgi:tetratricopeptide (TPR) repeat protein